jgi:hypothetical protein
MDLLLTPCPVSFFSLYGYVHNLYDIFYIQLKKPNLRCAYIQLNLVVQLLKLILPIAPTLLGICSLFCLSKETDTVSGTLYAFGIKSRNLLVLK